MPTKWEEHGLFRVVVDAVTGESELLNRSSGEQVLLPLRVDPAVETWRVEMNWSEHGAELLLQSSLPNRHYQAGCALLFAQREAKESLRKHHVDKQQQSMMLAIEAATPPPSEPSH